MAMMAMRKTMHMVLHEDDPSIPEGMAALTMTNNGWVGTNNGWPFAGQPALYPKDQAHAICYAWNGFNQESLPNLEAVSNGVKRWLNSDC